jgi:hypothetical protein
MYTFVMVTFFVMMVIGGILGIVDYFGLRDSHRVDEHHIPDNKKKDE